MSIEVKPTHTARLKKGVADTFKVSASLVSMFSGNPHHGDQLFRKVLLNIYGGRYPRTTRAFQIDITKKNANKKTVWVKSPHGAYIIVRTDAPKREGKDLNLEPAYALLFSQYPNFLARTFLWDNDDKNPPVTPEEIERKLVVVEAHYEEDMKLSSTNEHGVVNEYLSFAWASEAVREHTSVMQKMLRTHGSIMREGPGVMRSGSSIFYRLKRFGTKNKFDCYYYSNPVHGRVSLFFDKLTRDHPVSRLIIKLCSIKLNDEPLKHDETDQFMHEKFAEISRMLIGFKDPYDLIAPENRVRRFIHGVKTGTIRTVQKISNAIRNINVKQLGVSVGITAIFSVILQIGALAFFAASKTSFVMSGGTKIVNLMKNNFAPIDRKIINETNDISFVMASMKKNNLVTEEKRGLIVNPTYVPSMRAEDFDLMANDFVDTVPYTPEYEQKWAQGIMLDTLGIKPGSIWEQELVRHSGVEFLRVRQPNGLDIYYAVDRPLAFAHLAREQYEHCDLEVPIKKLFDRLPKGHHIIGLRPATASDIDMITFETLDDIPSGFLKEPTNSIQHIRSETADVMLREKADIMELLPEDERKKERDANWRKFKNMVRAVSKSSFPIEATDEYLAPALTKAFERNTMIITNPEGLKCPFASAITYRYVPSIPKKIETPRLEPVLMETWLATMPKQSKAALHL